MATKDYKALAAKKITRPSEIKHYPKLLVYSRNKKGKTTFGLSAGVDKTLVLDPEHGTDEFKTKNPHVWHIEKWEDMDDVYNFLRHTDHQYQWVVVDGLTKIANMSLKYVMKLQEERSLDRIPGMVQQRDYGKSGELMKEMLSRFHALSMGVIFTAQERQEAPFEGEEDEDADGATASYVPDLPKGVRAYANSIVDVIGRLYVIKTDDDKIERRLWIGESLQYDTGYRSDYAPLPNFIRNPSVPKVIRLLRTGSLKAPATTRRG